MSIEVSMWRTVYAMTAVIVVSLTPHAGHAGEPLDCATMLADIDTRIASGKYPDQNVMIAQQMRPSVEQMCGLMSAEQRADLFEGFEKVLPTRSEAEQEAIREARRAERKAARQARKAQKQAAEARRLAQQPELPAEPGGRSIAAQYLDRPEPMYHVYVWDWEVHDGKLRLVYGSRPSRQQYGSDDWTLNMYYAAMSADGSVEHRRLRSEHSSDHQALALRRGHDEIVLERNPGRDQPLTLERWAIDGSGRIASADITRLELGLPTDRPPKLTFREATPEGHLLYDTVWSTAEGRVAYGWCAVAVTGQVVACHTLDTADSVRPWSQFPYAPGGGLVVTVSPNGRTGLESAPLEDADAPSGAAFDSEKRLLALGKGSALAWQAPIERDIVYPNLTTDPTATVEETVARMARHHELDTSLRLRYDANRHTRYDSVGLRRVMRMRPTPNGVAFLTSVAIDKTHTDLRGLWLMEVGPQGELNRFRLEPLADMLNVRITSFATHPDGYYVYAQSKARDPGRVFKLDHRGNVLDYGLLRADENVRVHVLMADAEGVWIVGEGYEGINPGRVWLERMRFD